MMPDHALTPALSTIRLSGCPLFLLRHHVICLSARHGDGLTFAAAQIGLACMQILYIKMGMMSSWLDHFVLLLSSINCYFVLRFASV